MSIKLVPGMTFWEQLPSHLVNKHSLRPLLSAVRRPPESATLNLRDIKTLQVGDNNVVLRLIMCYYYGRPMAAYLWPEMRETTEIIRDRIKSNEARSTEFTCRKNFIKSIFIASIPLPGLYPCLSVPPILHCLCQFRPLAMRGETKYRHSGVPT